MAAGTSAIADLSDAAVAGLNAAGDASVPAAVDFLTIGGNAEGCNTVWRVTVVEVEVAWHTAATPAMVDNAQPGTHEP